MSTPTPLLDFLLADAPAAAVFLRAQLHPRVTADWACYQPFKPLADGLPNAATTLADLPALPHIYLMGSRQREENRLLLAHAAATLPTGGTLTALLPNDLGAKALESDIKTLFGTATSASKHHARRITAIKQTVDTPLAAEWAALATPADHGTGYLSAPGMFSWRKADAGSTLLLRHLPKNLSGKLADLGAGWGYLTAEILKTSPAITEAHLFEAEHLALACARRNLAQAAVPAHFYWADVPTLPDKRQFDVIVCNPPVHDLHDGDIALGQAFVSKALALINPRGRIYIVANRRLPYEALLAQKARKVTPLAEADGYKVLEAQV
jgi:16S rRNA (guanine1207-N2)-methyltransferase